MSLPATRIEERLSIAYVAAVSARAGASFQETHPDYGVDGRIYPVIRLSNGRLQESGYGLPVQVKATTQSLCEADYVVYDMDVDAYNKVALYEGLIPCILIVYRLPECQSQWLSHCENALELRNCCYWKVIAPVPSPNASTQRIRLPRQQQLTPEAIRRLLDMARRGVVANECPD